MLRPPCLAHRPVHTLDKYRSPLTMRFPLAQRLGRAAHILLVTLMLAGCTGNITGPSSACEAAGTCEEAQGNSQPIDGDAQETCSGADCEDTGNGGDDPSATDGPEVDLEPPAPMANTSGSGGGMCESPITRPAASKGTGFFVLDGKIFDANGCEFVPYGFNGAVYWNVEVGGSRGQHPEAHKASFADMGSAGANAVRIVTQTAGAFGWNANAETQRELVEFAVESELVPILEMHDATCGQQPIEPIRTYWESPPMVQLAQDFEETMWINIANEADFDSPEAWRDFYASTVTSLRDRGVNNLIVIDSGARCGQDPEVIFKYGQDILDTDPIHNVVFSFHMYGYWMTEDCPLCTNWTPPFKVEEEFKALRDTGLAIFIGEFGWDAVMSQEVLYDPRIVVETAEELGIGWTFWAWYEENPNYQAVQELDQPKDLTPAGEFLLPYIQSIAQRATHMGN